MSIPEKGYLPGYPAMIRRLYPIGIIVLLFSSILSGCGKPEPKKLEITPTEKTLSVGETVTFKAVAISKKNKEMPGVDVDWTVDVEAGLIDEKGRFTAKMPGNVVVKATSGYLSAEARVTIKPIEVAQINVLLDKDKVPAGTSTHLKINALSKDETPAGFNRISVSSPTEGVVLSTGELTLNQQGEAEFDVILSSTPGLNVVVLKTPEITKKIEILGTKISRIVIIPEKEKFEIGETVRFRTEGYDKFENHCPVQVRWSLVGNNVGLKDDDGSVIMEKLGKGIVVAQFKDVTQGSTFTIVEGNPTKIELKPKEIRTKAGQSTKISVKGYNQFGYCLPVDVTWTVEKSLGTVSGEDVFIAKKAGKGIIRASKGDVSAQIEAEVEHGPLTDIQIDIKEKQIEAGENVSLHSRGVDAFGNYFSIVPQWSLTKSLGSIDTKEATFHAMYAGMGEITAKIGNILKSHQIKIIPSTLSRLEISPGNINMVAGESIKFKVTGYDRFGNQVTTQANLSVTKKLGELAQGGLFIAKKAGNTVIEARIGEIKTSSNIAIVPADIETAVIEPKGPVSLEAGKELQFTAFGLDPYGNTVKAAVKWSLSPDLGTINSQGVMIVTKSGQGQVVATFESLKTGKSLKAGASLHVIPGEPAEIRIEPAKAQMLAGEERHFVAATYDAYGNKAEAPIKWTVAAYPVGDIDSNGLFRAVKAGTGKIRAAGNGIIAEAEVQVRPAELSFLKITPEALSVKSGDKVSLEAVGEDRFGNVVPANILWSITDKKLGNITTDGLFAAGKTGKGFIVATARNIAEIIAIEVKDGPLSAIKVFPEKKIIRSGEEFQFKALCLDAGGNELAVRPEWSAQQNLGGIDKDGILVTKKIGKGEVTAKLNDINATAEVEVVPGEPATIDVSIIKIEAVAGDRVKIQVKVFDANGNLIPKPDYRFVVEREMGSVTKDNVFVAHKAGDGNIKITSGSIVAEIPVEINAGELDRIEIDPKMHKINAGSQIAFKATGYDNEGNKVQLEPVWSVSGGIGDIDKTGVFHARTAGQGYASCRMKNAFGVSSITVQPGPVNSIKVAPAELTLTAGQSYTFKATAYDAYGNIASADFVWQLDAGKDLGKFAAQGIFLPRKTGHGKIVASAGDKQGYSEISVEPSFVKQLLISPKLVSLVGGEEIQLKALGKDEFDNDVSISPSWSANPNGLGQITGKGVFKAQKAGKGRVMAESDGAETSIDIEVTPGELKYLHIKSPTTDIIAGKSYRFTAVGYDLGGNAIPTKIEWAVTEDIGHIEMDSGTFHAAKVGKGTVVAHSGTVVADTCVEIKPGDLKYLFIEPNPVTVVSNKVQEFVITGLDVKKDSVPVPIVEWGVQGDIGVFESPGIFRATKQGKGKVTASFEKLRSEAYVAVVPGNPNPENSRLRVSHTSMPADGSSFAEIVVDVRDAHNNLVPGVQVRLISDRQVDVIQQPPKTNKKGLATGRISSTKQGKSIISAVINNMSFRDTAEVTFK